MKFDAQDLQALRSLDSDVTIDDSGEVARIVSELEVEITRVASAGGDQIWLRFGFSHELLVKILREQLLQELGVEEDENAKSGN